MFNNRGLCKNLRDLRDPCYNVLPQDIVKCLQNNIMRNVHPDGRSFQIRHISWKYTSKFLNEGTDINRLTSELQMLSIGSATMLENTLELSVSNQQRLIKFI